MRVVLDADALKSALLLTGVANHLVPLWQKGTITVLLSREILEEYHRVLAFLDVQLIAGGNKDLIEEQLLPYVQIIKPGTRVHVVRRNPSDNKFLECAVAGKANVVIAGDKELLAIRHYRGIRVQTSARFLATFGRRHSR